jgi:O-antigen/teichoic acid export membrane protein
MSASKRIAIAVGISWVSRAVSILSGLLLMPILFRFMGKEELGLWFLLGNSQAFLGLLGMGIAPTLTRRIAFAKGKSGSHPDAELTDESKQDIGDWVVTGKIILQWLAIIVFFIAWISGYGLIRELKLEQVSPQTVFWAWTLMCVGYSINVWVSYLECWLQGIGYVGWDSLVTTIVAVLTIVANIVAVLMGGGLLALAIISVISGLSSRFIFLGFIKWQKPELLKIKGKWRKDYFQTMLKPSLYAWLTGLGSFLILRTDDYFIAFLGNITEIPIYRATYQLVSNPYMISMPIVGASSIFISHMWEAGEIKKIHELVIRNSSIIMSIMAVGTSFILVSGRDFLSLWLGKDSFIGYPIIIVFCVMLTLEAQHATLASSSRATEDEKYVVSAILSGILNVVFTWTLIKPLGLFGVALGTMLAQLLTNNWYAVYRPLVRLKLSFKNYFRRVISLWFVLFFLNLLTGIVYETILYRFKFHSALLEVFGNLSFSFIVLGLALWNYVLSFSEKNKIKDFVIPFFKLKIIK